MVTMQHETTILKRAVLLSVVVAATVSCGYVSASGPGGASAGLDEAAEIDADLLPWVSQAGSICPDVGPALIAAQIKAESNWNPGAISPAGAQGIAQFMPGTWAAYGVDADGDGIADPFTPADAITAQGNFLCGLVRSVKADQTLTGDPVTLALAAYNAGLGNVTKYGGVPPFPETQRYVTTIQSYYADYAQQPAIPAASALGGTILRVAQSQLGLPYVWAGGTVVGPSGIGIDGRGPGFDCSGLTLYAVYQATGGTVTLPRVSRDQGRASRQVVPVPASQASVGDLVAFKTNHRNGTATDDWDHIGIVSAVTASGPTQMIHAPETGKNIGYADLTRPFYADAPHAYFRVVPGEARP